MGQLAKGEHSDVYLARRDARVTELVVVKMARGADGSLAAEWQVLEKITKSTAQGAPHFTRLLPQPVAHGTARLGMHGRDGERRVTIVRWRSGFVHTFDDIATAYSGGVKPESSVWLWKRILELLGWVHLAGWSHGAITAPHLVVHARDHGVVLIGWSRAVPATPAGRNADLAASAACMKRLLNGSAPAPIAALLDQPGDDAWAARDRLDAAARTVFGPAKYIPFSMPGWRY